jgi:hypothetical protein
VTAKTWKLNVRSWNSTEKGRKVTTNRKKASQPTIKARDRPRHPQSESDPYHTEFESFLEDVDFDEEINFDDGMEVDESEILNVPCGSSSSSSSQVEKGNMDDGEDNHPDCQSVGLWGDRDNFKRS